jgi:anti-anti-sigma regulatory factor
VCVPIDSLDAASAPELERELCGLVEHCESVVLDLSFLGYADHFGFQALLRVVQRCPGKIRFADVRPSIESLFILNGLNRAVSKFASVEDALVDAGESVAAKGPHA